MWTVRRYEPDRLAREWKAARWTAIAPFVDPALRDRDELTWMRAVAPRDRARALSRIFEAGRELGGKVRREVGGELPLEAILSLINHGESPCFHGKWKPAAHGLARELCRTYCPHVENEADCDYWREAARGLVNGLSDTVTLSRYESLGHEGEACIDVVHYTPAAGLAYGPLPEEVHQAIEPLVDALNLWGTSLEILGFNEGTLYFKLAGEHYPNCESCRGRVASELKRALAGVEPPARVREVAA